MDDKNYIKDVIEGFEEDLKNIAEEFYSTDPALKLENFFDYWSEKSLDCLFVNRFDPRELLESITEINQVLVKFIVTSEDHKHNIVAIYFLLCLYCKQPERFRRKFRLTCDEFVHIENLTNKLSQFPFSSDVKFVWKQLKCLQAFDLVEESIVYGPSLLSRKVSKGFESQNVTNDLTLLERRDTIEFLEGKIEPAILSIETLLCPYEQIKQALNLSEEHTVQSAGLKTNQASSSNLSALLDQAKTLLSQFKSTTNS